MDITNMVFVFTFSIGFDSNTNRLGYINEYGLLRLQIQIDVYRIRSEPDAVNIRYRYFFRYRVKATFTHITRLVTFEHPTSSNFN
jgi:hypothetical protein